MEDYYLQLLHSSQHSYRQYCFRYNVFAVMRFVLFVFCVLLLFIGYFKKYFFLYYVSTLCLFVFLGVVYFHKKIQKQMLYYQSLSTVYQQHIQRIQGRWSQFQEDGHEYIQYHQQTDLDILGHHSLFQMINICHTQIGKQKLASSLCQFQKNNQIDDIQKAVIELSKHKEMIFDIEAYGQNLKKTEEKMIHDYLDQFDKIKVKKIPQKIFIISFITMISLLLFICFSSFQASIILEIGFVFQLMITGIMVKKHQLLFQRLDQLQRSLQNYCAILKRFNDESFQSSLLKSIQNQIVHLYRAIDGINELSHIATMITNRQNVFVWILGNGFLMYDIYLRNRYIDWMNLYGQYLKQLFDVYGDLEVYMSLSIPQIDGFDVTMPHFCNEPTLYFEDLKHPLIPRDSSQGNDFKNHFPLCMITGSNMSGKTTFMRTIGLNLSLAYAGGYVFGKSLQCSWMRIMTSMRIQDNVEKGISMFYGELLRIKEMIDLSEDHIPMICFIDEIFKGTNSLDRIAGAKATLRKLSKDHIMVFITTHDFELCQIDDLYIDNYHFEESYHNGKIYFDYQIKKGQSQSTNGQFLLQQLGIIK